MKKWVAAQLNKELAKRIVNMYQLPDFTALLLSIRGISEREQIERFLDSSGQLPDPFTMKDMDKAVQRIREAVRMYEEEELDDPFLMADMDKAVERIR